jgi:hypothetical protein
VDTERRTLLFDNTEPDAAEQWYFTKDDAWSHWPTIPYLAPIRVAVIDSGIDASHPEFTGRIASGVSFVASSWRTDSCGHGTFVAGEIAANPDNGFGIAGLAFNARLLIAKGRELQLLSLDARRDPCDCLGRQQRSTSHQPRPRRHP